MAPFIKLSASLLFFVFFSRLTHQTMSQPLHMLAFCDELPNNFTLSSSYQTNRKTLLSSLRDRSSLGTYSNATIGLSPDTVHGMFLCRGDINKTSCSNCVQNATLEITKNNCTNQKEAIVFTEQCMVRYSNVSFFGLMETGPYLAIYSNVSFPDSPFLRFHATLSKKVEELIILTATTSSLSSQTPYYARDSEYMKKYPLNTIVQCSPDLDPANCGVCLRLAVKETSACCKNARMSQIFLPKCLLKYDTTNFTTSGSSSIKVMKGSEKFGRIFITIMTASVIGLVGL